MEQQEGNQEGQGLVNKLKKCTRNMAHNVNEACSSPKVQSRMTLAMGGFCAFVLLPLVNLLSLLIGHAEMFWGYMYKNTPMQLHGGYLLVVWIYVTYIGVFQFYFPQRSDRFPAHITRWFRIGHATIVFTCAAIIFGYFYKINFFDRPRKIPFDIDQEYLLAAGFLINVITLVVLYIKRPDDLSWGEIIRLPFEINVYRHLKCCSFGAVISMLVYQLDQTSGFDAKRDTLLLSYYFWAIVYCSCADIAKLIVNVRKGHIPFLTRRSVMVIRTSDRV